MSAVDGATHTQNNGVNGNGFLKDGTEAFNCAVPVRRSAVFEVLCPHITHSR